MGPMTLASGTRQAEVVNRDVTSGRGEMKALVIYETSFGNTGRIAQAIAEGLSEHGTVELDNVTDAKPAVPDGIDLLVVGGPTHVFSMSRASTREEVGRRQGRSDGADRGIRDWLSGLNEGDHPQTFAAFDTRMDVFPLTGSAAKVATRAARHLGFAVTEPNSFVVDSYEGPLRPGEIERARAWGAELARQAARE